MARKGMVIDLKKCVGCQSCTSMCKLENFTPPGVFFTRVLTKEYGKYPAVRKEFWPVLCNHCADPACVSVCPTGASAKRDDGIVTVDAKKCIGCRYCMIACPYRVRFYLPPGKDGRRHYFKEGPTPYELYGEKVKDYQPGTVIKCDLCVSRQEKGLQPACVATCSSKARYFGDLDDPDSEVSRLIAAKGGFQLLPEKGTDPSVYYLY